MDIIAACREAGTYRGAAQIAGTTHKTVQRVIAWHEAGGGKPARVPRGRNYDGVAVLVAGRIGKTAGRISAKRLLRAAGYGGSDRNFRPEPGVIFHSDRGCQPTSAQFAVLAGDCQVALSTGRKGQCWDNALAESFFGSIKGELLDLRPWPTRAGARRAIVEYIAWYNSTRLHSALGYRSPAEFEASHHNKIKNVA
jgi:transposase InsO family protein